MKAFDSFDDMVAWMHEQEALANAALTPEQREIGYGDHWVRQYDDILIFGYIPTFEEIEAQERALGAEDEEIQFELEMFIDSYGRGYRYGKCYSVVEPDGEWGSTHIVSMVKITKEQFDFARANNWELTAWPT
jgi:hypothetical protein